MGADGGTDPRTSTRCFDSVDAIGRRPSAGPRGARPEAGSDLAAGLGPTGSPGPAGHSLGTPGLGLAGMGLAGVDGARHGGSSPAAPSDTVTMAHAGNGA
ncbi:hypothetical protein FAIPA1_40042 [Frankia sp. AiPs1]